jgi:hypothetical protein
MLTHYTCKAAEHPIQNEVLKEDHVEDPVPTSTMDDSRNQMKIPAPCVKQL